MLLWQPATVFCVVYCYLFDCLTWQINSLSLSPFLTIVNLSLCRFCQSRIYSDRIYSFSSFNKKPVQIARKIARCRNQFEKKLNHKQLIYTDSSFEAVSLRPLKFENADSPEDDMALLEYQTVLYVQHVCTVVAVTRQEHISYAQRNGNFLLFFCT